MIENPFPTGPLYEVPVGAEIPLGTPLILRNFGQWSWCPEGSSSDIEVYEDYEGDYFTLEPIASPKPPPSGFGSVASDPVAGHVTGTLVLQISGGEPVELGTLRLPLIVTQVSPEKSSYMRFGIGVDLESVKDAIKAIFDNAEVRSDV